MSDINEKVSASVDGEFDSAKQLDSLVADAQQLERWQRYHLIRDAMHEQVVDPKLDITQRVSAALQDEPTVLAPRRWTHHFHPRAIAKQVAGMAVAAAVATVAVLTVQQNDVVTQAPGNGGIASVQPANPDIRNVATTSNNNPRLNAALESRLSDYLVQHNEYSAAGRIKGVMPYTRIVSVVPGEAVVKKSNSNE